MRATVLGALDPRTVETWTALCAWWLGSGLRIRRRQRMEEQCVSAFQARYVCVSGDRRPVVRVSYDDCLQDSVLYAVHVRFFHYNSAASTHSPYNRTTLTVQYGLRADEFMSFSCTDSLCCLSAAVMLVQCEEGGETERTCSVSVLCSSNRLRSNLTRRSRNGCFSWVLPRTCHMTAPQTEE